MQRSRREGRDFNIRHRALKILIAKTKKLNRRPVRLRRGGQQETGARLMDLGRGGAPVASNTGSGQTRGGGLAGPRRPTLNGGDGCRARQIFGEIWCGVARVAGWWAPGDLRAYWTPSNL